MPEERIADRAWQKNTTDDQTRQSRAIAVSLLQKQRPQTPHARARKVAQAKSKRTRNETNPQRTGRKKFLRRRIFNWFWRGSFLLIRQPRKYTRHDDPQQTKF